jgi:hypothetical protein
VRAFELHDRGVRVRVPVLNSSLLYVFQIGSGVTEPSINWVTGALSPELQADHSSPTSVEVKKMWVYISTSPYIFVDIVHCYYAELIKKDNMCPHASVFFLTKKESWVFRA